MEERLTIRFGARGDYLIIEDARVVGVKISNSSENLQKLGVDAVVLGILHEIYIKYNILVDGKSHLGTVSEWMDKSCICVFTPTERAVQYLDLIGKVHGFLSAENYFNNLRDQDKTEKTCGALQHCYVRQRQIEKSLSHFQKMKEIGITSSPLAYNDIICLYKYIGQNEKVHVLTEMKESGVSPDSLSYRICMNSYGESKDIERMEKILNEMENQPDMVMDWNTYAVVANFYIKADLKDKANDALKKSEEKLDRKDGVGYNHLSPYMQV